MGGTVEIAICDICGNLKPVNRKYYKYDIKCDCCSCHHHELIRHCNECVPKPPNKVSVELHPLGEKGFIFKPNKYYKHTTGHMLHTLNVVETTMWGRTLVAEVCSQDKCVHLIPVGIDSESYTANYTECTEAEWMTNFSK